LLFVFVKKKIPHMNLPSCTAYLFTEIHMPFNSYVVTLIWVAALFTRVHIG